MKKSIFVIVLFAFAVVGLSPEATKPARSAGGPQAPPTFSKEVVRIFQQNCQSCHHPNYIAPFSLMTYEEAKPYAFPIKSAVQERRMPPWKAAAGCGNFHDERILTQDEISTLVRWVEAGAPEGDPKDLPAPISFPDGWMLGEPDIALQSAEAYPLAATGDDVYRCFPVSDSFQQEQYVTAAEILPDNTSVVHHVLLFLDSKGESVKLDAAEPGPGYTCFGGPGFIPAGGLGGWAPGNFPRFAPKGVGAKVPKGSRVVMQVHYHPNGEAQQDRTRVGLHFAKEPVQSDLRNFPIFNFAFLIPPGKSNHKVTAQMMVPPGINIKVLGITPHMHLLGKSMKIEATLPNGNKRCLVNVDNWDFKWQGSYAYKDPVSLPGGTRLKLTAFYDNSVNNPNNPNNPPKPVYWGEQTTDEMCLAFVNYIIDRKTSSVTAAAPNIDELDGAVGAPRIKMGSIDMLERARIRMQSSLFSSAPVEMYNWSEGFSRNDLNILPWRKASPDNPRSRHSCH
ncbi:MAG: ascorbate-dependent monooxygenase [Acidobacteriota bacterium]